MAILEQNPEDLKKKAGALIFSVNSDIIELQQAHCRFQDGTQLSKADEERVKRVEESKQWLEKIVTTLESMPDYIKEGKMERVLAMMKVTLDNVNRVNLKQADIGQDALKEVTDIQTEAKEMVDKLTAVGSRSEDIKTLTSLLSESVNVKEPDNRDNIICSEES